MPYGVTWAGNKRIVFSAMVQDSLNISRINADGTESGPTDLGIERQLFARSSSDGRFIVFTSNRRGGYDIWRMNVEDGSDPQQLTSSNGNFYPSISSDNQWLAYDNQQPTQKSVWKVPLEGGQRTKVIDRYRMPVFSPDSQFILARYDVDSGTKDTADLVREHWRNIEANHAIPNFEWQRVLWLSPTTLSYIDKANGYPNIWTYDLDTGKKKQLTNFTRNLIFSYAWSSDHKLLACQLGTKTSNVVKLETTGKAIMRHNAAMLKFWTHDLYCRQGSKSGHTAAFQNLVSNYRISRVVPDNLEGLSPQLFYYSTPHLLMQFQGVGNQCPLYRSYCRELSYSFDNPKNVPERRNHPRIYFNKRAINFFLTSIEIILIRHTNSPGSNVSLR